MESEFRVVTATERSRAGYSVRHSPFFMRLLLLSWFDMDSLSDFYLSSLMSSEMRAINNEVSAQIDLRFGEAANDMEARNSESSKESFSCLTHNSTGNRKRTFSNLC